MAIDFSFLNPLSFPFVNKPSDANRQREIVASKKSYGQSEDTIDWYAWTGRSDLSSNDYSQNTILFDAVFQNKRQRISTYRYISCYPLVKLAMNILVNECTQGDSDGNVCTFGIKSAYRSEIKDQEYELLKEQFSYIMNCVLNKRGFIYDLLMQWWIDGELYLEKCLNEEGNAIAGLKVLPPYACACIYQDDVATGYIEDVSTLITNDKKNDIRQFPIDQIAYSNYGEWITNRNDIRGHLESAIKPIHQLRNVEDSMVIARMVRAPERLVWNVYTGRLQGPKADEVVAQVRNRFRNQYSIDTETGSINGTRNVLAFREDYWLSKNADNLGTTVETLKGGTEFGQQIDDIYMFQRQVMDALMIPPTHWRAGDGESQFTNSDENLNRTELDFHNFVKRKAKRFLDDIVLDFYITQLRVSGWPKKFLDSQLYDINFVESSEYNEYRELTKMEKKLGLLSTVASYMPSKENVKDGSSERPFLATDFVLKDICKFTDEQIQRNKKLLNEEIKRLQGELPDDVEEEEEDDGGFGF